MIGRILRDRNDTTGLWVFYSVLDAELWSILKGLKIAIDRRFDRIFILSDSQEVVQAVQRSTSMVSNSALVR